MSATADFYLARAAENAKAAEEADLVNVRERCLRAEAAWRSMADRSLKIEKQKREDALEKAIRMANGSDEIPWPLEVASQRKPDKIG